jgi:hypothetical protein
LWCSTLLPEFLNVMTTPLSTSLQPTAIGAVSSAAWFTPRVGGGSAIGG